MTTEPSPSSPSGAASPMRPRFTWETFFAGGIFAALLVTIIAYLLRYSTRIPLLDEWNAIVPALTGEQRVTLAWLWEPHNDYRILLPRLLILGLLKLTGSDFRAGGWLNLALLTMITVGVMWAAAKVRGRVSFTDALFPILLLHLRNYENIFWFFQCQVVLPVLLAMAVICYMCVKGGEITNRALIVCALACLASPLCGLFDISISLPLSLGLAVMAASRVRSPTGKGGSRSSALLALVLASASILLVSVYFIGLKHSQSSIPAPVLVSRNFVWLLGLGIGTVENLWIPALFALLILAAAIVLIALRWARRPDDRWRTGMLAVALAGSLAVPLGIAYVRTQNEIASRYALLCAQSLIISGLIFALTEADSAAASPVASRRLSPARLLSLAAFLPAFVMGIVALPPSASRIWNLQAPRVAMETAMAGHMPLGRLVAIFGENLFPSREYLYEHILGLANAGVFPFSIYAGYPESHPVPLRLDAHSVQGIQIDGENHPSPGNLVWHNGAVTAALTSTTSPMLYIAVPDGPRLLRGIRLHYSLQYSGGETPMFLQNSHTMMRWGSSPNDLGHVIEIEPLNGYWHRSGQTLTLYIDEPVSIITLVPYGDLDSITITGIDLLVPEGEAALPQ